MFFIIAVVDLLFVHFLHLHTPVLKPDFDLSLRQIQDPGHLVSAVSGKVHIEQKLLFEFQSLVLGVRTPLLPRGACVYPVRHWVVCEKSTKLIINQSFI